MRSGRLLRLTIASVAGLTLAVGTAAVSISISIGKKDPSLAVRLLPNNCRALALQSFVEFQGKITDPSELAAAANATLPAAREALRCAPLLAKPRAIAVVAQSDEADRRKALSLTSKINRRDLFVQSLVMQDQLNAGGVRNVFVTFDQILRVNENHYADFFPALAGAIANQGDVSDIAELLNGGAAWNSQFLDYAVTQPDSLTWLAQVHPVLASTDEGFDAALIAGLTRRGSYGDAWTIYRKAAGEASVKTEAWPTRFAPFDWDLTRSSDVRVTPDGTADQVEVHVRAGSGGWLGRRVLPRPGSRAELELVHAIKPATASEGLRVIAKCTGSETELLDEYASGARSSWKLAIPVSNCDFVQVALLGRAPRTGSDWSGSIKSLRLRSDGGDLR